MGNGNAVLLDIYECYHSHAVDRGKNRSRMGICEDDRLIVGGNAENMKTRSISFGSTAMDCASTSSLRFGGIASPTAARIDNTSCACQGLSSRALRPVTPTGAASGLSFPGQWPYESNRFAGLSYNFLYCGTAGSPEIEAFSPSARGF